jgi:hypothetical protein
LTSTTTQYGIQCDFYRYELADFSIFNFCKKNQIQPEKKKKEPLSTLWSLNKKSETATGTLLFSTVPKKL